MGHGGRGGHGLSHSGGQEEANGSDETGMVREREDEDDGEKTKL
jgi:hypothetical protein